MFTFIKSDKYIFEVKLDIGNQKFDYFEIKAFCRIDNKWACITNINFFISELLFGKIHYKDIESTFKIKKKYSTQLYNETIKLLNKPDFIKSAEEAIDEDRDNGEWENEW